MVMRNDKSRRFLVFSLLCLFVAGCDKVKGTKDLEEFVSKTKSSAVPEVEPLPGVEPAESYQYAAAFEGNPFSIINVLPEQKEALKKKVAPLIAELSRDREALEFFPLDSLEMAGTLTLDGTRWAIIMAPDGTVHRVSKGNYLGTNLGEILEVVEGSIKVEETVQAEGGELEKRIVAVALPK